MGLEYGAKKSTWWEMILGAIIGMAGMVFLVLFTAVICVALFLHRARGWLGSLRWHSYRRQVLRKQVAAARKRDFLLEEVSTAGGVLCERSPNNEELGVIRALLDRLELQSLQIEGVELYYSSLHVACIRVWYGELKIIWLDLEFSEMLMERLRVDLRAPAGYRMEWSHEELALRRL